jgi:hypothetical protein
MPVSINNTTLTFNDATTMTTAAVSPIPAGTVMLFYQAAAPTGWTQVTTQNNKALRVVSGTGGGTGGTTGFTSVFTNQTVTTSVSVSGTTGSTTLSTSQMPSHTHSIATTGPDTAGGTVGSGSGTTIGFGGTEGAGGGGSHNHSFSGSGSGTSSAVTLNVQYIDIILASKD